MASVTFVPSRISGGDFVDVPVPGSGDNGKAVTYNHSGGAFVYTGFEASGAVAAHVALANPHTQYLLSSGYTAADVLTKLLTVDVDGSGLNATTLQGSAPDAFAASGHTHAVPGSTTQVIFNSAGDLAGDAGMTYDAANDALTVAGRVVTGVWRPAADGVNALLMQSANGTTMGAWDSTNKRLCINGGSPRATLDVKGVNSEMWFGHPATFDQVAVISISRRANYGDVLFAKNLRGWPSTDEYRTVGTGTAGWAGIEFRYGGIVVIHTSDAATTQDAVVSPSPRVYVNGPGYVAINGTSPTALLDIAASNSNRASQRIRSGSDPTTPNDGDIWYNSRLKFRRGSTTEIIPTAAAQSAYTQTYSTAARTVNAYTTDAESGAYTGVDNLQVGSVYATVANLNSLRTAYENLRAMADNLLQVVTALIDDGQAFGMT